MKVLHVISTLSPRFGGPSVVVRMLSDFQVRSGLSVTVCSTNWNNSNNEIKPINLEISENGVEFRYFSFWSPLLLSFDINKWFYRNIQIFDIIHVHGLYRFPVSSAAWWARKKSKPYIISPHGSLDLFLYKQSRYNVFLKRIHERLFDIPNLNHSSAIHYTAEDEVNRSAFLNLRAKPVILPNGIDWEDYRNLPIKGNFRRVLGLSEKTQMILFLGRINFKKGLNFLVPAFSRVLDKHGRACLVIVGPDNEGYGLKVKKWCNEHNIQDKVLILDHLDSKKVNEAYVDADVFVLPSYTENFGMTVVEAMACGTPVVISDQVNIWREIKESGAGIVVGLDSCQVADAICILLEDKGAAKAMGKRGRVAAEKRYAWPPIVKQLTGIYEE